MSQICRVNPIKDRVEVSVSHYSTLVDDDASICLTCAELYNSPESGGRWDTVCRLCEPEYLRPVVMRVEDAWYNGLIDLIADEVTR